MDNKKIEIPFGAKDSKLCGWDTIPEGMEAVIENGKVIVRKKESEDERIRKAALEGIEYLEHKLGWDFIGDTDILNVKEYLERQKEPKDKEWENLQKDFKRLNEAFESGREEGQKQKMIESSSNPTPFSDEWLMKTDFWKKYLEINIISGNKPTKADVDYLLSEARELFELATKERCGICKEYSNGYQNALKVVREHDRCLSQKPAEKSLDSYMTDPDGYLKDWSNAYDRGFEAAKELIVTQPEKYGLQKPAEWDDADMKEARNNLISVCMDWERGEKTTLLPVAAVRARYFLEHLVEPKQPAKWDEEDEQNLNICLSYIKDETLRQWLKDAIHAGYNKPAEWSEDIIRKAVKEVGLTQHQIDWFKTNVFPPKQEWNEEDEIRKEGCLRYLANLRDAIEFNQHIGDNARKSGKKEIQKGIDWLKNLSERFNLLPKQEWSEEDYNAILIAIDWLQYYRDTFVATGEAKDEITACVNRLKSLRPQPHWKPSEEHFQGLRRAITKAEKGSDAWNSLTDLYEQLKKL